MGADADTLGAITGSIAEALWGIPEWIKVIALTYLPEEMKQVVADFGCTGALPPNLRTHIMNQILNL